ncbi:MAG: Asp-tRNA(Asn)/Glu-tRNA(Gln) amidotransferase subunit GatB [Lachnospiraceae bacterium]|nr:Asp-tRNA(Asn)/Glu-tRNA(Gln) amidotransferase subunit GatB [Lachnospiraceae bacterium]
MRQYETVIGLEVHVELSTQTKIFCGCSTRFGAPANANTCPVCTGMPGALPVLNRKVVEYALALGLAMNCKVNQYCCFDRKNYFYPDNPQNYQISQLYLPICRDGEIEIEAAKGKKIVRIHEMHMEEDAGKLIHDEELGCSLVDYNRSGVPLLEIVSEPDMKNAEEVIAYLEKIKMLCQYLGISDCKLQEGSMRADVNLSVRPIGSAELGTRTEMKNLASFRAITKAIEVERARQIGLLEAGGQVEQETRRWDENKECSYPMRSKEDAKDYRYFPDPDLQPVMISDEWLERVKKEIPEFAPDKKLRFQAEYGLSEYDAALLTQNRHVAGLYEETVKLSNNPKKTANWFMGECMRLLKEKGMDAKELKFTPKHLADLILSLDKGEINQEIAKAVFERIFEEDIEPLAYMKVNNLLMISDTAAIEAAVDEAMKENAKVVEEYRSGKEKVLGFLVGQVMKRTKGMASPGMVTEMLKAKL